MYLKALLGALLGGLFSCGSPPSIAPVDDNPDVENKAPADNSMGRQQNELDVSVQRANVLRCGKIRCPEQTVTPKPTTKPTN